MLRIINLLKVGISKSKERVFTAECLAEVVQALHHKVEHQSNQTSDSDNIQSKMAGIKVYSLIQGTLDQYVKQNCMQDYRTTAVSYALMTPETAHGKSKVRSLLSQFR